MRMSETAEKLERISDVGVFETLATQVLRGIDKDCAALLHLGLNATGKPIPGPIDGFGRVPGPAPGKYVTAAFTTMSLAKLEQKWLGSKHARKASTLSVRQKKRKNDKGRRAAESGDLIKALNHCRAIRKLEPSASFIVYLCTNRTLDPRLMTRVWAIAARCRNVEVRFLDQSRLRDFLDITPEGQWLRLEHLRIAVEHVSASLLHAASRSSLKEFSASILAGLSQTIITDQTRRGLKALENQSLSLHILVGPSGIGKSVLALQLHRSMIDSDRFAFWIPAEVVERSVTLGEALDTVLRSIYPTLIGGAGPETLQIASGGLPLFLVIDDINRLNAPDNVLKKILGWSKPHHVAGEESNSMAAVQIVCPVWESYSSSVNHAETQSWVGMLAMRPFLRHESLEVLHAELTDRVQIHPAELERIASALNDDPILLGLFVETLKLNTNRDPVVIAEDVVNSWVNATITELGRKTLEPVSNYLDALEKLATEIVVRKKLYPTVVELRYWCGDSSDNTRLLFLLAEAGHICRISNRYAGPVFEFRHDRILEFFIACALERMLGSSVQDNSAVWDPFFTSFLGQAIGRRVYSDSVLDRVFANNANALIVALSYVSKNPSDYATGIKQRVRARLTNYPRATPQEWHHGLGLLREMNSPAVLEVSEGLSAGPILLESRLRNGDAAAGTRLLSSEFWPGIQAPWIESMIGEAALHNGSQMLSDLRALLCSADLNDDLRCGALVLTGYLASAEMIDPIRDCWMLSKNKQKVVLPAIWAALRCSQAHPEDIIGMMLPIVMELPDDPTGQTYSHQYSVLQQIGWSSRHGFTETALNYLVELGNREEYLRIIVAILSEVPHHVTVAFAVRRIAEWKNQAEQKGSFSPFASTWLDNWRRWKTRGRISDSCVDELRQMWARESEPAWLREYAFRVWNAASGDLATLRSVTGDPVLHEAAVWYRMLQGDRSVTADVVSIIAAKSWWIEQIPKIWSDELEPLLTTRIERHMASPPASLWSNEDYHLAHVIRDIPPAVAEKLLAKYWEKLQVRPLFVQAALYVSTDQTRTLAGSALRDVSTHTLEHIGSFFGFMTSGLVDRLSVKHLESLHPHLGLLDDMTIAEIVDFSGKNGLLVWAKTFVLPECEHRRAKYLSAERPPSLAFIDRCVSQWMPSKKDLSAQFDRLEGEPGHLAFRIELLLQEFLGRGDSSRYFVQHSARVVRAWTFNDTPAGLGYCDSILG